MSVPHALPPCIATMRITGCIVRKRFQSPIHCRVRMFLQTGHVPAQEYLGQLRMLVGFCTHQQGIEDDRKKCTNPKTMTTFFYITSIFVPLLANYTCKYVSIQKEVHY